ncbi:MAG: hypothetical protein M9915_03580 [Rhizobacter sp.]|nr:hypothetical protein [Rhizobacter sp.]
MNDPHWLDDPKHVKLLWRGFLVVLALTVLAEPLVHLHPHFEIESWFAFHAWYGLLVCIAMIAFAKALALVLKRPDTYYDSDATGDDPSGGAGEGRGRHD